MISVLLADDHQMIREGLRMLLNSQAGMQVVGEAADGREAVELVKEHQPSVVVMDLNMPELNGVDATKKAIAARPGLKVVCLSAQTSRKTTNDVFAAGATGFVMKESAFDELARAIRTVVKGKVYVSPAIAGILIGDYVRASNPRSDRAALSDREREVLQLISEGQTTKSIASRLDVSVKTVETHRRNLMQKLNVDSVAELTKYAIREGITTP